MSWTHMTLSLGAELISDKSVPETIITDIPENWQNKAGQAAAFVAAGKAKSLLHISTIPKSLVLNSL